jgi:hypothetical protein
MSEAEQAALYAQAIMDRDRAITELRAMLREILGDKPDKCGYYAASHVMSDELRGRARALLDREQGRAWEPPRCRMWLHDGRERTGSQCCLRLGHIGAHVSERQVSEVKP